MSKKVAIDVAVLSNPAAPRAASITTSTWTVCARKPTNEKHMPSAVFDKSGQILALSGVTLCGKDWHPAAASPSDPEALEELQKQVDRATECERCAVIAASAHELKAFAERNKDWVPVMRKVVSGPLLT